MMITYAPRRFSAQVGQPQLTGGEVIDYGRFVVGSGGVTPAPQVKTGGGGAWKKKKTIVTAEPESIDRRKLEEQRHLREEIEDAYNALHGLKKPPNAVVRAVKQYIPVTETKQLPAPELVDFTGLIQDLAAVRALLAAYDALLEEEETLFLLAS